ncbi:MAG: hypothetical protein ABIP77_03825 [Candidatus Limnocylindrales bacterium]
MTTQHDEESLMDDETRSPKGVGDSDSRRGEDESKGNKEPGREDTAPGGPTDRPTGTSTARDMTGVDPQDPITGPNDERSG